MKKTIALMVVLLVLSPFVAFSASDIPIYESDGAAAIISAFKQLQDGDRILVYPGTYDFGTTYMSTKTSGSKKTETHLDIAASSFTGNRSAGFTIEGQSTGKWDNKVIFKGKGRFLSTINNRPSTGSTRVIKNITFDGFNAGDLPSGDNHDSRGGAIRFYDGRNDGFSEWAENCVFRNCKAQIGGAVDNGMVVNCEFYRNETVQNNAAVSNCRLKGSYIHDNVAKSGDGGMASNFGTWDTTFERNTANGSGGALTCALQFPVSNCTFVGNVTTGAGGAIYGNDNRFTDMIIDCTFVTNKSTGGPGGAICFGTKATAMSGLLRCVFVGNECQQNPPSGDALAGGGGAVFLNTSSGPVVADCAFTNNVGYYGGGFGGGAWVSNCTFVANRATGVGGGLFINAGGVSGCTFETNSVYSEKSADLGRGGGAYSSASGAWPFNDCVFSNNFAVTGGGLAGAPTVSNCTFIANFAGGTPRSANNLSPVGGGLAFCAASATVLGSAADSRFIDNVAWRETAKSGAANVEGDGNGGGVGCVDSIAWAYSTDKIVIRDCAFTNNLAFNYGGAACHGLLTNCLLSGNGCVMRGAGVYDAKAVGCTFTGHTRKTYSPITGVRVSEHGEYGGTDACHATLVWCDCDGGGLWECAMLNCTIHDVREVCVFYEENFATNCLIRNADTSRSIFHRYLVRTPDFTRDDRGRIPGSMVNCTFADNAFKGGTFSTDSTIKTNLYNFVNCIFYGSKTSQGAGTADLSGSIEGGLKLQNCLYESVDPAFESALTDLGGNIVGRNPKFIGEKSEATGLPRYSIEYNSPARNAGAKIKWWKGATDLAGKARVFGKSVDIGCYECLLLPPSMVMTFED